tara:strand:- start:20 stop:250 length:231 start_codon:yes stop_codon:yes gene_type:complete
MSSYVSSSPSVSNLSSPSDVNFVQLVIIMLFYVLVANIIAPLVGYFIAGKQGIVIGFIVGLVVVLALWLVFGRNMI